MSRLSKLSSSEESLHPHQQHQSDSAGELCRAGTGRAGRTHGRSGRHELFLCDDMTIALHTSELAAPPRPPFPELDRPLSSDALADRLRAFSTSYYARHPFHERMHAGRLSPAQLQGWVANRLAYQRAIPRKDAAIISNCPVPEVRREWIQRIVDHDGSRAWHRRDRDVDPAGRSGGSSARGDGGRASRPSRRDGWPPNPT